jgi:putative ABC transport system permease protein
MRNAVVKSLLAHKLRLALTAISVVLGVSFITGTFVLTDTLSRTFDTLFGDVYRNTDVVVRAKAAFTDISTLVIPVGQLALYVVLAGVVGVLAAVLPARRAAKLNVLRAVAST